MAFLGGFAGWILLSSISSQALFERAGNEGTIFNRLSTYATAWRLLVDDPVFGIGLTMFKTLSQSALEGFGGVSASYAANVLAPHNTVLLVAVEAGVVAAALLGFAMLGIIRGTLVTMRATDQERWISYALMGVIIVTVINGVAMDVQLHAQAAYVVSLLAGLLFGAASSITPDETVVE
jgi:O-antigen ligase